MKFLKVDDNDYINLDHVISAKWRTRDVTQNRKDRFEGAVSVKVGDERVVDLVLAEGHQKTISGEAVESLIAAILASIPRPVSDELR